MLRQLVDKLDWFCLWDTRSKVSLALAHLENLQVPDQMGTFSLGCEKFCCVTKVCSENKKATLAVMLDSNKLSPAEKRREKKRRITERRNC